MVTLRVLFSGCAAALLLLTAAPPASAGGCQAEIDKLCKGQTPIMNCLRQHQSELSPECSAYLAFFEQIPSCVSDARHLCPTEKPSGAGVIACLRGRQSDLSDDCRREIGKLR